MEENVSGKGKSFIIPFCSSLELGVRAKSERFQRIMELKEKQSEGVNKGHKTSPIVKSSKSMFSTTKTSPDVTGKNYKKFSSLTSDEVLISNSFLNEVNSKSNSSSNLFLDNIEVKYKKVGANGEKLNEERYTFLL